MGLLRSETWLEKARKRFSAHCAKIEQAWQQDKPPTMVEVRRMEFEAVEEIVAVYGYDERPGRAYRKRDSD
jgi:hypothetical protein